MIDWKLVSSRIMVARFKSNVRNVTVIQCYAPTEDADMEAKEAFYAQLNTMTGVKKQDIVMVMGDLNAKVGSDNTHLEQTMGRHGLGDRN
jgi:exonuclease III